VGEMIDDYWPLMKKVHRLEIYVVVVQLVGVRFLLAYCGTSLPVYAFLNQ
jgi:hypothetical protein